MSTDDTSVRAVPVGSDPVQEPGDRSPVPAIYALSVGLVAVAALLVLVVLPQLPTRDLPSLPPWWVLLLPAFALSELFTVHLRVGRSAFTVSFGHIPLVLGVVLLDPVQLLTVSVLGSAFTLVVHRRQWGLKLLFNVGLWAFEAALALTLYRLIAGDAPPASLLSLLAVLATILVTDQLTALAVTAVISLHEGELERESIREALTWGLLVAVCNTSVGLLVVVLVAEQPFAVPLLLVMLGMLGLSYRAYEQLHRTHQQVERQHDFAQALARVHGSGSLIDEVLEQTRTMMQVEVVEAHVDGRVHRCTASGVEEPTGSTCLLRLLARPGPRRVLGPPAARHSRAGRADDPAAQRRPRGGDGSRRPRLRAPRGARGSRPPR